MCIVTSLWSVKTAETSEHFYYDRRFRFSTQARDKYCEDSCWLVDCFWSQPSSPICQWQFRSSGQCVLLGNVGSVAWPPQFWAAEDLQFPFNMFPEKLLWCRDYNIKCIIDLHAAPGSQNGMEHSASRDGWTGWPTSDNISKTLNVIDFLAKR